MTKYILILSSIILITGCLSPSKQRCFGASSPTDLNIINSGNIKICTEISTTLFNDEKLMDKVCLNAQSNTVLCYELENIPSNIVYFKIDSVKLQVKLNSLKRNEIDLAEIIKNKN